MIRDVFYFGNKPNVHPREKFVNNIQEARNNCSTEHFWIINEFCDYKNFDWDFDFDFLPDDIVWHSEHNNVWPSQHCKDSGTWLCSKNDSDVVIYRDDVKPIYRKKIKTHHWKELYNINQESFDFSWHPDPTSPPYIYVWGCRYFPSTHGSVLEYHVEGATQYKFMDELVELLPNWNNWKILQEVDKQTFDFSWHPDPTNPPYIYVWGNQHYDAATMPTIEYHVSGATQKHYIDNQLWHIKLKQNSDLFKHYEDCNGIDYSWRPNPNSPPYIYVWGNQWNKPEDKISIEFRVEGATEYQYMLERAIRKSNKQNWFIPNNIDDKNFDYSWEPNPNDPPYVYEFGTQWQKTGGPKFVVKNATEIKYVDIQKVKILPSLENWTVPNYIDIESFDFSWHPDNTETPYIYEFATAWNNRGGPIYTVSGATEVKYIEHIKAKTLPNKSNFQVNIPLADDGFDFSWLPNPDDPPYIYVFGNQWNSAEIEPTVKYYVNGASEYKFINEPRAIVTRTGNWKTLIPVDEFDYSWRPNPRDPAFIYVFGNKWNDAATEPTVQYEVEGATGYKYMQFPVAVPKAEMKNWSVGSNIDLQSFDFTWRPNPFSPPQIYQWENNGPRYTVPGATEVVYKKLEKVIHKEVPKYYIKTTLIDLINEHLDEVFWALNPDINYSSFDFKWKPDENNFRHINVFGSQYSKDIQTYYVNGPMYQLGHRDYNYIEDQKVIISSTNLTMFFIDKGNINSEKHFQQLKIKFPELIKTRYLNSWVDTISRCIKKSKTKLFWVLNSEYDYNDFVFDFYPSPWQLNMIHVFGTQWSHWGHTYLINSETFIESTKYIKTIEHLNCLNFVRTIKAKAVECLYDIYLIDFGNIEKTYILSNISQKYNHVKITIVPYNKNYLQTFKDICKIASDKNDNFIWVGSTVCNYDKFDFTYIADPFARDQLHVFPSNNQKYGDTFLVNLTKLREQSTTLNFLNDYEKINFNSHQKVYRFKEPEIVTNDDTLSEIIQTSEFDFPYAVFKTSDNKDIECKDEEHMSLWSETTKNIIVTSTGASRVIVPKDAKQYVKQELYDYPFIIKKIKKESKPLDIVFLSNGEINADENYEHLLSVTKGLPNRIVRVDGVNGRVNAYHAAANASNTNWLFTVFAKLKVSSRFDWSWQPDRLSQPKHYIFYAENPVNGLIYGHQAMIAYNKKLTLKNMGKGLDFTLDDLHDTVPILSGVAEFNMDPYSTWRTSFREVIKLKSDYEPISQERLQVWLSKAQGNFAEYSLYGAKDAVEYYDQVQGDIDRLKLSYEWKWLKEYFNQKYKY